MCLSWVALLAITEIGWLIVVGIWELDKPDELDAVLC